MSADQFRSIRGLGENFSNHLASEGVKLVKESSEVLDGDHVIGEDELAQSRTIYDAGEEKIKQAFEARRVFAEFEQTLARTRLLVPFLEYLSQFDNELERETLIVEPEVHEEIEIEIEEEASPRTESAKRTIVKHEAMKRGERQRLIISAMLQGDEKEEGWRYETLDDSIADVYSDKGNLDARRIKYWSIPAKATLRGFIASITRGNPSEYELAILKELREDPRFSKASSELIASALKREISYQELVGNGGQNSQSSVSQAESPEVVTVDRSRWISLGDRIPDPETESDEKTPLENVVHSTRIDLKKLSLPKVPERDLTPQEKVLYSLMLIDERRNGYEYHDIGEAIRELHEEELDRMSGTERGKRIRELTDTAKRNLQGFLFLLEKSTRQEEDEIPPIVGKFITWAENQPFYDGFTQEDLARVLERKMSFWEVVDAIETIEVTSQEARRNGKHKERSEGEEKVHARLNREHKYILADMLLTLDPKERQRLGVDFSPEQRNFFGKIRSRILKAIPDVILTSREYNDSLVAKLRIILRSPEKYLTNLRDREASTLYYALRQIRSEEQIEELVKILY